MKHTCTSCGKSFAPPDNPPAAHGLCPECVDAAGQQTEIVVGGSAGRAPLPSEQLTLADAPSQQETLSAGPQQFMTSRTEPAVQQSTGGALTQLGPYRIERVLGKGGMGLVYEATDTRLDRRVALKVIKSGEIASSQELARFRSEAQSAGKLKHPNIVPIYDIGRAGEVDYFVMEYVEGTTLDGWLRMPGRSYRERAVVIEKVARAIHHAHEHGVIHRDLKPGNVMVDAAGQPHVMDFGLARNVDAQSGLTMSGQAMGTPSYMPPEQAQGAQGDISPRSDVWSLGAVLYEALTGRPPFTGDNILLIVQAVVYEDPPSPRDADAYMPLDLETIALKCLEKEQARRYQSAAALADDLRRYLDGDPIAARPASLIYKTRKKIAKHRGIAAVSALAIALLAGVGVWSYISIFAERDEARDALAKFVAEQAAKEKAEAARKAIENQVEAEAAREWQVVFSDDFERDEIGDEWKPFLNRWRIIDGWLVGEGDGPTAIAIAHDYAGDVRIEYDARITARRLNDLSCFMLGRTTNKFWLTSYSFSVGGRGNLSNRIVRCDKDVATDEGEVIERGRIHRVRAEKIGHDLRLFVDGERVCAWCDDDPLSGEENRVAGLWTWSAETQFDNLKVYTLALPRKADLLELADGYLDRGRYATAADIYRDVLDASTDTARAERASVGGEEAARLAAQVARVAEYRARLEKAWPGAGEKLVLLDHGLQLDVSRMWIKDLEPIRGMRLAILTISENNIQSLEPLRGMPLEALDCSTNRISDLGPLHDAPLTTLRCRNNPIVGIEALRGMRLAVLDIAVTGVGDLSPLAGMPIAELLCGRTRVRDLLSLTGAPLVYLDCEGLALSSVVPIGGLPLEQLRIGDSGLTSLEFTRGMPLKRLACPDNGITDLEPLRGMALTGLSVQNNRLESIGPLNGMPLNDLNIDGNQIADLGPLARSAKLKYLRCAGNPLRSIEPLRNAQDLMHLNVSRTHVADIGPLSGLEKLEYVYLTDTSVSDLGPLAGVALQHLNALGTPVADSILAGVFGPRAPEAQGLSEGTETVLGEDRELWVGIHDRVLQMLLDGARPDRAGLERSALAASRALTVETRRSLTMLDAAMAPVLPGWVYSSNMPIPLERVGSGIRVRKPDDTKNDYQWWHCEFARRLAGDSDTVEVEWDLVLGDRYSLYTAVAGPAREWLRCAVQEDHSLSVFGFRDERWLDAVWAPLDGTVVRTRMEWRESGRLTFSFRTPGMREWRTFFSTDEFTGLETVRLGVGCSLADSFEATFSVRDDTEAGGE